MDKDFVNLAQISRKVGSDLDLSYSQSVKIITAINNQIAQGLKTNSKVRLHGFGLFYLKTLKSRSIYQIRTGQKRLLLEKTVIKFMSSPTFKYELNGTKIPKQRPYQRKEKINKPAENSKSIEIKVNSARSLEIKPTEFKIPAPAKPIDLIPIRMMDRVDPIRARENIAKRLKNLAKKRLSENKPGGVSAIYDLSQSPSGKLFAALFRQVNASGGKSVHFSISRRDLTDIFYGRPKKKITQIPTNLASDFLKRYLEIVDFDIPQERFVKIYSSGLPPHLSESDSRRLARYGNQSRSTGEKQTWNSERCGGNIITRFSLSAHSLPTGEGASIYLKIERIN